MDIGGHPPFPTSSKQFSGNFGNLLFFVAFNFRDHFEGLNEVFSGSSFSMIVEGSDWAPKMNLLDDTFPMSYRAPQTEIVCQSYTSRSWYTKLPKTRSTKLLAFHLPGLGFWILFMIKISLVPHCNNHLLFECEYPSHIFSKISCHYSSESFTLYFYSIVHFTH